MSLLEHSAGHRTAMADADAVEETSALFTVSRDRLDRGSRFDMHAHQEDQIAWAASGSVDLEILGERWHLRPEHLVWIPASVMHEMVFPEASEIVSLYVDPLLRPPGDWTEPVTLQSDQLVEALLIHLTEGVPSPGRRARCRRLLAELLVELPVVRDVVALPRDPRARAVASQLLADLTDDRDLVAWAAELRVSTKTLTRAFQRGTGTTFREWRANARLLAATRLLAGGTSVEDTASGVGYVSTSSFIAAFKRRFGVTPARYVGGRRGTRPGPTRR